jgi:L-alanine-DL-glutamate epimerase-like enolase superfamily enzyme
LRIDNVTLELFNWDQSAKGESLAIGNTDGSIPQLGLLRIITDDGVEGHAFLGSPLQSAELDGLSIIRYLKPVLLGQDPLDRERLFREMISWQRRRFTTLRAIGAVDIALWDIAGKVAGLPIHKLIGTFRHRIAAYASSQVFPSTDSYVDDVESLRARGYQAYKIHPFQHALKDIALCESIRKAVGDDYTLMLDSMWAHDYPEALRVGQAIQDLRFYWFEDPLREHDLYNYVKLREKLTIPIMATEFVEGGLDMHAPWLVERATDFLRGDVAVKGGITAILKIAHLAEAFNINFEIHDALNPLSNVANLHVTMAIPNTEYFEILLLPALTKHYGLKQGITPDREGFIRAPEGPGLGAEIDFDLIRHNSTAVLR